MKISALIVDDEIDNCNLLLHMLKNHCPIVEVVGMAQTIENALTIVNHHELDIVFLDIELSHGRTGFDLVNLQILHPQICIVFVTAYEQYTLRAIKVHAFDYILKPVSIKELKAVIQAVSLKIDFSETQRIKSHLNDSIIRISNIDSIELVKQKEILFFQACRAYTEVILLNGKKIVISKNIGEIESTLGQQFLRIHHSYIINTDLLLKIEKVGNWYCLMSGNIKIPISRRKKHLLLDYIKV